ncbi:GNAT family N-acetyltransferase [Flavihumibacter sp. R14]|nr:GNAT family N-acetyltransferase [Flavihumibacter soli]
MIETGIVIREAVTDDSEAIASLSGQLGYPSTIQEARERLARVIDHPESCVFVAVNDMQVIGWIHCFLTIRVESAEFAEIAGLVVDEGARGKHAGKELVSAVINWARKRSVRCIRVRSNIKRHAAHEFYRHIGFNELKDQKIFSLDL